MTTINWLTLFREIIAIYCENYTKPVNTLRGQNAEVVNVKVSGTYSNHSALKGLNSVIVKRVYVSYAYVWKCLLNFKGVLSQIVVDTLRNYSPSKHGTIKVFRSELLFYNLLSSGSRLT
jgi:hypothetical protein